MLELSLSQKIQVGFVALMFGLTGFLVYRNTRPVPDTTITSWVETRRVGLDPRLPLGPKNPADPSKAIVITIFACHDGHLEITEYPEGTNADPGARRVSFAFRPDMRRKTYDLYTTAQDRVSGISDPYKHALAFAAYSAADGRPMGLLGRAGLDPAQLKSERDLRQSMLDDVALLREKSKTGTFEPEMYEKVLAALATYKARDGDPAKDKGKAALAHKVVSLAVEYVEKLEDEEALAVEKYIKAVDVMLTSDQKTKLAEVGKLVKVPGARPSRKSASG